MTYETLQEVVRVAALFTAGCALSACFFAPERPVDEMTTNTLRDSKLALGRKHACAIDSAGELWCWGQNRYGQLGQSPLDLAFSGTPQRVGAGPWTAVVAGTEHTCALREGQVTCWGANHVGQASTGSDAIALPVVIDVPSTSPLVRLDAGGAASCAFDEAGTMYCWGRIDSTAIEGIKPARIEPAGIATGWAQIGIAADHACARTTAGDVRCWGGNGILQLGLTDQNADIALANAVTVAQKLDDLAVGPNSNCGITSDDRLYCWGDQVITQSPDPTTGRMLDTRAWSGISIGDRHACAITTGKDVHCWGGDSNGALGRGTLKAATTDRMFGDAAMASADVAVAGDGFTCARSSAGELSCWGANIYGELGNGDVATTRAPYLLAIDATDLALGDGHTCVRGSSDSITCWGNNFDGQLGSAPSPPVSTPPSPRASAHNAIAAGTSHTCGRSPNGTQLTCWGIAAAQRSLDGGNAADVSVITSASVWNGFAASGNTTCGKSDNGAIRCWGALGGMTPIGTAQEMYLGPRIGVYVQQGTDSSFVYYEWGSECFSAVTDRALPLAKEVRTVPSSVTVQQVAVGADHVCSIENGQMFCWGRAESGEASTPVETCAAPRAIQHPSARLWRVVTAAGHHTCGIDTADQLYCWGDNDFFQLGGLIDGGSTVPQLAHMIGDWKTVVTSLSHSCGVTNAGELYCWGLNRYGEVGNGKTFLASPVRVALP